jgi:hypothetical protein
MRIREVTVLSGGAADTDVLAASQALQGATANTAGLAAAQQPNIALDADGIVTTEAPQAATPLTLQAAAAALSPARRLTITSAANLSGVNFEIVGTDRNGDPQTVAAFAGPNNTTVTTAELWSSITSITPDATDAGTLTAGWPATYRPMTLTGAAASLNPARLATLTSTGNFSGVNFVIDGLDADGNAQQENIAAGPNNNTVTGSATWSSITAITPDPADTVVATNISAGWPATTGTMLTQGITLNGAADEIAVPRELTLTSASDLSGITFTLYGRDRRGNAFTEELVGPNADTVTSLSVFGGVDRIVPSATNANSVSAGLVAGGVSPWFLHDTTASRDNLPNGSLQVLADPAPVAGQVEYTHQNAARIFGEGAEMDADPTSITGTPGEIVVLEKRPWFRIRNTEDAGSLKVAIARPRF